MYESRGIALFDGYQGHVNNGRTAGDLIDEIANNQLGMNWTRLRQPYFDRNGDPAVTINTGRTTLVRGQQVPILEHRRIRDLYDAGVPLPPVCNATSLRKEEWIELDRVVIRPARYRLRAWADLASANTFGGFNGMSKEILEHEVMSDPGEAVVDMDALSEGRTDAPKFQLRGLPLPITHSDFYYSARRLATSRNSGTPLDTTSGEAAGRRVAEAIEKTTIGIQTGMTYGGNSTYVGGYDITSSVYGYLNYPQRQQKTGLYRPTGNGRLGTGWTPLDTVKDVLACLDQLYAQKFYGPFNLYYSNDWTQSMGQDYFTSIGSGTIQGISTRTLLERLEAIENITAVRRLDFLFSSQPSAALGPGGENLSTTYPFTLIFVAMVPETARAVSGLDMTTIQWETVGGMRLNFKVMAIQVPQIRSDIYGNCGVLQGSATT